LFKYTFKHTTPDKGMAWSRLFFNDSQKEKTCEVEMVFMIGVWGYYEA